MTRPRSTTHLGVRLLLLGLLLHSTSAFLHLHRSTTLHYGSGGHRRPLFAGDPRADIGDQQMKGGIDGDKLAKEARELELRQKIEKLQQLKQRGMSYDEGSGSSSTATATSTATTTTTTDEASSSSSSSSSSLSSAATSKLESMSESLLEQQMSEAEAIFGEPVEADPMKAAAARAKAAAEAAAADAASVSSDSAASAVVAELSATVAAAPVPRSATTKITDESGKSDSDDDAFFNAVLPGIENSLKQKSEAKQELEPIVEAMRAAKEAAEAKAASAAEVGLSSSSPSPSLADAAMAEAYNQSTSGIGGNWAPPDDTTTHKPSKSGSWGVFERPADISKAYGGGKRIGVGAGTVVDEEKARAEAEATKARLARFRKDQGASPSQERERAAEINAA